MSYRQVFYTTDVEYLDIKDDTWNHEECPIRMRVNSGYYPSWGFGLTSKKSLRAYARWFNVPVVYRVKLKYRPTRLEDGFVEDGMVQIERDDDDT